MARTAQVRARIDPELKEEAERVLDALGLTPTEAIRVFYRQLVLRDGLPFAIRIPNTTTRTTFERSDRGEDLRTFDTSEEMFDDLGI